MDSHEMLKRKVMKDTLIVVLLCLAVKIIMPIISHRHEPAPQTCSQKQLSNMGRDDEAAASRWRQAANRGDTIAQYHLAWDYFHGYGVKQDYKESADWYRKAALLGCATAQNELGNAYHNGAGVEKNEREAVRWWQMAAAAGDTDAQDSLRRGLDAIFSEKN